MVTSIVKCILGERNGRCYPGGISMPKQRYYLLLANRDSTTEVLKERDNIGKTAKVLCRNKRVILLNLTRHPSPVFKLYLSHQSQHRTEQLRDKANFVHDSKLPNAEVLHQPGDHLLIFLQFLYFKSLRVDKLLTVYLSKIQ